MAFPFIVNIPLIFYVFFKVQMSARPSALRCTVADRMEEMYSGKKGRYG